MRVYICFHALWEVVQHGYHVQHDVGVFVCPWGDVHTVPCCTVHSRAVVVVDGEVPWGWFARPKGDVPRGDIRVYPCVRPASLRMHLHVECYSTYPSL